MSTRDGDSGFLSRWSRRKVQARDGVVREEPAPELERALPPLPAAESLTPVTASTVPSADTPAAASNASEAISAAPPPTLADVAALTRESDFSRFVAPDVEGEVKNAALKKLFGDPHFNVMDGLDVYIDDYSKPDPLPVSMVRKMAQAAFLGLVEPEAQPAEATARPSAQESTCAESNAVCPSPGTSAEPHEDADLRLQPHDAAGCGGAEAGASVHEPRQL